MERTAKLKTNEANLFQIYCPDNVEANSGQRHVHVHAYTGMYVVREKKKECDDVGMKK